MREIPLPPLNNRPTHMPEPGNHKKARGDSRESPLLGGVGSRRRFRKLHAQCIFSRSTASSGRGRVEDHPPRVKPPAQSSGQSPAPRDVFPNNSLPPGRKGRRDSGGSADRGHRAPVRKSSPVPTVHPIRWAIGSRRIRVSR